MHYRFLFTALIAAFAVTSHAQQLISSTKLGTYTKGELILLGIFSAEYNVDLYHITYHTDDPHGNPTTASGALAVPVDPDCDSLPLANYNHGTVLHKNDVPSRKSGEELVGLAYASRGFATSMPDYLGLGDGPGLHPYQHAESEATATLDMIRASREYLFDSLGLMLNGEVFLTGYSQGGHAAMATHKYIQENGLLTEFNVIAAAPASGAYDMSETTASFIFNNAYSNPGYIVYIVEAFQEVYGNIYKTRAHIYKPPYDKVVVPYLSGDSTMGSLNAVLKPRVDSLLQDSVLANFVSNPAHPLRLALMDNDVYDWAPQARLEMNYCEADEQVPYQNSVKALDTMTANGAVNVTAVSRGASFDHGGCAVPSLTAGLDLFLSLTSGCLSSGIADINNQQQLNLYPNPASGYVIVEYQSSLPADHQVLLTIHSMDGRKIDEKLIRKGKNKLDISSYPKGIYFIQLAGLQDQPVKKLIVQ